MTAKQLKEIMYVDSELQPMSKVVEQILTISTILESHRWRNVAKKEIKEAYAIGKEQKSISETNPHTTMPK